MNTHEFNRERKEFGIMAEEKKTATVKPIAKAAVKAEAAKEEKKEAAVAAEAPAKKEEPKKAAPAKKAEAPKKAAPAKKAAAPKKEEPQNSVWVEWGDKKYSDETLIKIAKDVWVYDLKQKAEDFKNVDIYVKPYENVAYYVINGTETGSFSI